MSSDAASTMVGTIPVGERDRLDLDRLTAWMTESVEGFAGPLRYAKFAGGQSNPTYRLDTPARAYVLRRKPFGPILPSAHAVEREYAVIAGLHPTGFPVPRRARVAPATSMSRASTPTARSTGARATSVAWTPAR